MILDLHRKPHIVIKRMAYCLIGRAPHGTTQACNKSQLRSSFPLTLRTRGSNPQANRNHQFVKWEAEHSSGLRGLASCARAGRLRAGEQLPGGCGERGARSDTLRSVTQMGLFVFFFFLGGGRLLRLKVYSKSQRAGYLASG